MVRHQAALASGQLTRVTSGVNLPPPEVIMSRPAETVYLWSWEEEEPFTLEIRIKGDRLL
jgi:hypothetical protein